MTRHTRRLLVILILLVAAVPAPLAQAEGGQAFRPYWTFTTEAPVTHVEAGDIDGDGVPEVVAVTANNWVYALENDGALAWRYETGFPVSDMALVDLEDEGGAEEIVISTQEPYGDLIVLGGSGEPTCARESVKARGYTVSFIDLDGDGRLEVIHGADDGITIIDSTDCHELGYNIGSLQPIVSIWTGDVDNDGQAEFVPSFFGGWIVYALKGEDYAWRTLLESEMALVQGGDVDGDGQPELVVLGTAWDLYLLASDGNQIWHQQPLPVGKAASPPGPGQLIVRDLNGDGQAEIVVVAPTPAATVHVFDGDGRQVWEHTLESPSTPARLVAGDKNGDGQAELVVTTEGGEQVYLLTADGQRQAEYHIQGTANALDYADLNHDGWGEVIVGAETGVQVFGTSNQVVRKELWRSPRLGSALESLLLDDLDGDGQVEVVAKGSQAHVLADDGRVLHSVAGEGDYWGMESLSAGDVDGDGHAELVSGNYPGQVRILGSDRQIWTIQARGEVGRRITSLATCDLDGDGRAELVAGSYSAYFQNKSLVTLLDGQGKQIWEQELAAPTTAMLCEGEQVLIGTEGGQVYRLTADGSLRVEYKLGSKVLAFGQGMAATADGRLYRLDAGAPNLVQDLGVAPSKVVLSPDAVVIVAAGQASLAADDGTFWPLPVDGEATSIAAGDVNGDGVTEVAVGTHFGRVHLFGLALDQPPMLTKPDLAETRTGYVYSVHVNDPDGDAVTVDLEIWDPSAGAWLAQPAQSLAQGQGRLTWNVTQPFDTWDSGRESRFRFRYDDGVRQYTTQEIAGPFTIPTTPWYGYYGQRFGLGALILLVPALGLLFYRRQRAYRRSSVGQAEALLKELRDKPDEALCQLHDLARDDPIRLAYMPGLAREAGERAIADLSEGFHLTLTRPEVTAEDLGAIVLSIEAPDGSQGEGATAIASLYELFQCLLEASTVSRIVALRSQLGEVEETLAGADCDLAEMPGALADLGQVAQALRNYQRVETVEDKIAYLGQVLEALGRLDREFRAKLPQPERNILTRIAANWLIVTNNALQDLQGRAQIEVSLKTRQLTSLEGTTLSLELRNSGRSPASNISVALLPGQGYTVRDGAAHLDILPAGRSALVELPVSATPSVGQFRAEITVTFDDREREGKRLAFADMVHLLRPAAEFQPIPNPYAPGTPLAPGSPIFFGREDLFQFIAENMAGLARQNILVLIGQRRMGKTSFLQQLPARLGEDYMPVYIDGQSLGIDPGMANFFYDLSLAIVDALAEQGIEVAEPEPADFAERPSGAFERGFLPAVFQAIGGRQLLLLFDEFEELEMRVKSGRLEPTVFPFFRHLMQHVEGLGFIFVGTHRMEALSSDYWSIFFNIALYKQVAFLGDRAARELIVKPVAGAGHGLGYDDLAVDKMLRVTAGHPYFLQLICHALVNYANRERRGYLTIRDVNDILEEMLELGEAHFAFLWDQSSPAERLALATLTRLLGYEPSVTASQVAELLAERGAAIEEQQVTQALRRLVERDIVREVRGQPPRYEFKIELVRLWLERHKTLGRVVEEVG
jgi:hypothetical protein